MAFHIDLVKLTDTFNTFMNLVNSIINKINKIEVDSSTVKLKFSSPMKERLTMSISRYLNCAGLKNFARVGLSKNCLPS